MTRIILEMPDEVIKKLNTLVKMTDSKDKAEVIGKALSLYDYVLNRTGYGMDLFLRDEDGVEVKVDISFTGLKDANDK